MFEVVIDRLARQARRGHVGTKNVGVGYALIYELKKLNKDVCGKWELYGLLRSIVGTTGILRWCEVSLSYLANRESAWWWHENCASW